MVDVTLLLSALNQRNGCVRNRIILGNDHDMIFTEQNLRCILFYGAQPFLS
jgi:hypothetical protein